MDRMMDGKPIDRIMDGWMGKLHRIINVTHVGQPLINFGYKNKKTGKLVI